jgi:signal transduction histidine kinase/FixJ family two-component response regulator
MMEHVATAIPILIMNSAFTGYLNSVKYQNLFEKHQSDQLLIQELNKKYDDLKNDLEKSKVALQSELKRKDQILASVSHELRNPINSLLGNLDLAYDECKDKNVSEKIDSARICTEMLLHMINNLIDAARVMRDDLLVSSTPTDIYELIEKVWRVNRIKLKQKNLKAELCISTNLPRHMVIDPQRTMQILMNLILNAIKFTENGRVRVYISWHTNVDVQDLTVANDAFESKLSHNEVCCQQEINNADSTEEFPATWVPFQIQQIPQENTVNKIAENYTTFYVADSDVLERLIKRGEKESVCTRDTRGLLKFDIIDTGCGMTPESQDRAFKPFSREDTSNTRRHGGSGLGLYIILKIVKKLGGTIKLFSKRGVGSNFVTILPCMAQKTHLFSMPLSNCDEKDMKALIIEDDGYIQKVLKSYMEKLGIEATICENGNLGYEKFVSKEPGYFTVITMDIQMPVMDGITAARYIREHELKTHATEVVPIVFLSGNNVESERLLCIDPKGDIRATFFYRKPLTFTECQSFVHAIVANRRRLQSSSFHS